jgi:methyltransferase (TIGR00027 family)
MTEYQPSKTALGVAMLRAAHQIIDESPKILDDPAILTLLGSTVLQQIQAVPGALQLPQSIALRSNVLMRSRYAEDCLHEAVKRGVSQYMLLGAGFDTFAYRQPDWARALRIFEVDQIASQNEKRDRLSKAGMPIPENVEFVAIDFESTPIATGLQQSSFDFSRPVFVSWLGVMVYLTEAAADAVFKFVVSLPRGSEMVFTFAQPLKDHLTTTGPTIAELAAQVGEPWKLFITPDDLRARLANFGYTEVIIPGAKELHEWYIGNRTDGLYASPRVSIARAVV